VNHPMQPTPEQFGEWLAEAIRLFPMRRPGDIAGHVARLAYAAGADAELEACYAWTAIVGGAEVLRAARRPAPTPQQRALAVIGAALSAGRLTPEEYSAISEAMGGLEIANA